MNETTKNTKPTDDEVRNVAGPSNSSAGGTGTGPARGASTTGEQPPVPLQTSTVPPKEPEASTPPPAAAPTPPPVDEPEEEKVEVEATVLKRLLDTVEKQGEQIKDLTEAADLGRLSRIQQARMSGKLVKRAKISVYNDKFVLGWKKVTDDVYFDEQGRLHEDQQVSLFLYEGKNSDGTFKQPTETQPMSYRAFSRLTTKAEGEVVSERTDKDGQKFYTIQLEGGEEIELSIVFLN